MAGFIAVCGLVAAIAAPVLQCCQLMFGPMYRAASSFFNLQSNLRDMERMIRDLENRKDEVTGQVQEAAERSSQTKEWLTEVEEILKLADHVMVYAGRRVQPAAGSGCFFSYGLSRRVSLTLNKVHRLLSVDAYPTQIELVNLRPPMVEHIPVVCILQFQPSSSPSVAKSTPEQNLDHVMDLLKRDQVRSVCIWGTGGVGKTTLVKNLNNKLKREGSEKHFGMVIWATVSKDFNRKRVQTQIANRLKLQVGESDEERMAIRLHERLQKEKKFLLILDDAWEAINLDRLGIPKPDDHEGYKILVTTRRREVCTQMNMDEEFRINVLEDEEAWQLFKISAGEVTSSEHILPFAKDVARECGGLPLAIAIVGAAMRRKERVELWKDALNELRRSRPSVSEIEKEVFNPLKWSYDSLQGEDIKSCFLYCCLYPEDFSIEVNELVKCWVGEGLIDEQLNHEDSLNRGLALIENLKDACLLETCKKVGFFELVKMHDVVRDVAIWIASSLEHEHGCKHLVQAGVGLTEVEFTIDARRVSLMRNNIKKLPCRIECCTTTTLFLQGNCCLEEIPKQFQAIRVLNVSGTNISSLSSIIELVDLRTLISSGCQNLTELPTSGWGGVQRLQVLDLSGTCVRELPAGMRMLIKLRELNLSRTLSLESISDGVFSALSSLEILNMRGSRYCWGLKSAVEEEAHLEELESLNRLQELYIPLKPKTSLSWPVNHTWIQRLKKFGFYISAIPYYDIPMHSEKYIFMTGIDSAEEERTEYLSSVTNTIALYYFECKALDRLVKNIGFNGACFPSLKSLSISHSSINLRGGFGATYDLLPNLEDLCIYGISGLKSISELAAHLGLTFSKLRWLWVGDCQEMEYLLSAGHHLVFESLKNIKLTNLLKLKTLCGDDKAETWPSLVFVEVKHCYKLRKLPISARNNILKEIRGEESWWSNLEWDDPNAKTSLQHLYAPIP